LERQTVKIKQKEIFNILGLFTPPLREGQKIFYGTQHVYCLIRYYFTLYERFVKAREVSNEFEDNSKTRLLSPSVNSFYKIKEITFLRKKKHCQKNVMRTSNLFFRI